MTDGRLRGRAVSGMCRGLRDRISGGFVRINVDNIPAKGRHVRFAASDAWAREAAEKAVEGDVSALSGHLHFVRGRRRAVDVSADASVSFVRACDLCGASVELALSASETLHYVPEGATDAREEQELSEQDLDVGWYADGAVVVADVVSELLALALPSRFACDDASNCTTAPVAETSASPAGHPAFAALKELL